MATHSRYSCQDNPRDRGAWQATVHGVTESDTTKTPSMHTHIQNIITTVFLNPYT